MSYLAWMGWQMRVPADWRPLRIEGDWTRGYVIAGDASEPVLQVKWWRPGRERFDADRWITRRLKALRLRRGGAGGPTEPRGFTSTAWVPEDPLLESKRNLLRMWYGYAELAGLVIEVAVSEDAPKKAKREVWAKSLPSMTAYDAGGLTRWAVFGGSFESPAGYRLTGKKLLLGDLAVWLRAKDGSQLTLRQVYPYQLAIGRRKLERWMDVRPYKERRRYRSTDIAQVWRTRSFGRTLVGMKRIGQKRLPAPLGFCSPRRTMAVAVHDADLDRLLLAEHESPHEPDEQLLAAAIGRMNWAHFESGGDA